MWAKFNDLDSFNAWHETIKEKLGIPLPDGITTEYTQAHLVEDGTYSAWVEQSEFDGLVEGLPYFPKKEWE